MAYIIRPPLLGDHELRFFFGDQKISGKSLITKVMAEATSPKQQTLICQCLAPVDQWLPITTQLLKTLFDGLGNGYTV